MWLCLLFRARTWFKIILCKDTQWAICSHADFKHESYILLNSWLLLPGYLKGGCLQPPEDSPGYVVALATTSAAYWPEVRGSCLPHGSTTCPRVQRARLWLSGPLNIFWTCPSSEGQSTTTLCWTLKPFLEQSTQKERQIYIMKLVWTTAACASLNTQGPTKL